MGIFKRPAIPILPDPDPKEAQAEIRKSEENRQHAFARFLARQQLRGPSQLSAKSPGLRFLTRRGQDGNLAG